MWEEGSLSPPVITGTLLTSFSGDTTITISELSGMSKDFLTQPGGITDSAGEIKKAVVKVRAKLLTT